jgi:hypothetical protein
MNKVQGTQEMLGPEGVIALLAAVVVAAARGWWWVQWAPFARQRREHVRDE